MDVGGVDLVDNLGGDQDGGDDADLEVSLLFLIVNIYLPISLYFSPSKFCLFLCLSLCLFLSPSLSLFFLSFFLSFPLPISTNYLSIQESISLNR